MAERTTLASPRSRSVADHDPPVRHHQPTSPTTRAEASLTTKTTTPSPYHTRDSSALAEGSASRHSSASPSQRVTRSSARQAANLAASSAPATGSESSPTAPTSTETNPSNASLNPPASARKRKAATTQASPSQSAAQPTPAASRRSKRQKTDAGKAAPPPVTQTPVPVPQRPRKKGKSLENMSSPEIPSGLSAVENADLKSGSSSRKSSRGKKARQNVADDSTPQPSSSSRQSKRNASSNPPDADTTMTGTEEGEKAKLPSPPPPPERDPDDDEDDSEGHDDDDVDRYDDDDDEDDPFSAFGGPGGAAAGLSNTLRALTGMMSGLSSRLRELLANLRQKEDPSMQLIALQELSEILLVSNEDNLSGHFSPDSFVKELVSLMQPNEMTGEENPEIMLLACRCLANLMEALPASVANVVYGGAVPVLCQKLLEISFIDLAEQALSTLEKISAEYPSSIVREGGLTACLSYLDFFATSTQRTAVTTAANCCRNIPEDSFPVIRDVMPTLLNVLSSNDQRVVEQASLCVSGIVESFKYQPTKLEELVSVDLLKAVLRLLVPGTTNLIGPNIHTQFLRVLAFTARSSPQLSAELFKLNVVEVLYQILTGVSPPSGTEDVASKLDSVVIMQALIHRPREQIIETLNVICELLPNLPRNAEPAYGDFVEMNAEPVTPSSTSAGKVRKSPNDKRLELLGGCKEEVRRFALILFPTLTDAFSSTVNLNVRQKVLTAQLKMLSNLDESILAEALKMVPYASFLASILSQQDHPTLVMLGLQATELLLSRLDDIYRYQLYREGVISEINKLATQVIPQPEKSASPTAEAPAAGENAAAAAPDNEQRSSADGSDGEDDNDDEDEDHEGSDEDDDEEGEENEDDNENDPPHDDEDGSGSPVSSGGSTMSLDVAPPHYLTDGANLSTRIRDVAKKFLETHDTEKQGKTMKKKALEVLSTLSKLAEEMESFYLNSASGPITSERGAELFGRLVTYFDAEVLESVTSAELLASGLVRVLLAIFSNPDEDLARAAQSTFLQVFMGTTVKARPKTATADSPATPFSVMIHKLQDLLSRSEHFEVITVHHNTFDHRSSAASMLAKQIRLKLVADDESDIPRAYRNIMVSIHAIATFKSLDDYLRPRISLSERPRGSRRADTLSRALAAMAGAGGLPPLSREAAARFAERASAASGSSPIPPPPPAPGGPGPSGSSRSSRKAKSRSLLQTDAPATPDQAVSAQEKASLRRSSRRTGPSSTETPPPAHPPIDNDDDLQDALECADEKQLTDDEEMGSTSALDAIVGELDEDMGDSPAPDPSAVNLEVAAGGKVTARDEDGTRIPTPAQGSSGLPTRAGSLFSPPPQQSPSPSALSRPMSYSAAIQTVPQDWHIEFSLDDKPIPSETTIYRAVHIAASKSEEHLSRSLWSTVHPIKFRRAPGPPPPESNVAFGFNSDSNGEDNVDGIPSSLAKHPATASILRLLNLLHELNANVEDVLLENKDTVRLNVEPLSQFVNTKLTAKLNRQLEEPLVVASNCLPSWAEDLARLYPFIFPFETRHLFLQSTSFGYARSMTRWQNAQSVEESRRDRHNERPFLGRLQRQKVRISRSKILESALKVMELYGASQSILEVEYFEEVGTGLGPTLEFYSTVSKEFSKKKLKLWRETDSADSEQYISGASGLFPRPLSDDEATTANGERIMQSFKMLGKFVARSMIDSRIIDLNFNPIFFRIGDVASAGVKPSLGAVKVVDPGLARSLKTIKMFSLAKKAIDEDPNRTAAQKVVDTQDIVIDGVRLEDLCLDFTLPGYPEIELVPGGSHAKVTIDNVDSYLDKVIDMTLGTGVRRQVDAFRAGFTQVFPYSALSAFTPDELVSLFGRVEEDWSLETLMDSIKADHGFNMDSKSVKNLLQTMSELTPTLRRDFLQFTTGSPKLPIGGFKALTPMFTVVCKPSEAPYTSDDYLPSVMTCVNYLKLPDYTSLEVMRKQLFTAIKEGQGAFHLS